MDDLFLRSVKVPDDVLLNFIKCKKENKPISPDYDYARAFRNGTKFYCVDIGPDNSMIFQDRKGKVIPVNELKPGTLKASFDNPTDARKYAADNSKGGRGYAIMEKVETVVVKRKTMFTKEKIEQTVTPLELFASGEAIDADELLRWREENKKR